MSSRREVGRREAGRREALVASLSQAPPNSPPPCELLSSRRPLPVQRLPQSLQSLACVVQTEYWAPEPPSSHAPSLANVHVSVQHDVVSGVEADGIAVADVG